MPRPTLPARWTRWPGGLRRGGRWIVTTRETALRAEEQARRSLVEACYAQWSVLGFSGRGVFAPDNPTIIDIEALVLATLVARDDEKRLDDALGWWAEVGATLTSRHRARALRKRWPDLAASRWAAFAGLVHARGTPGWSADASGESGLDLAPRSGKGLEQVRTHQPGALMARLRLGLGVGARADLLTWLIGRGGQAATVADAREALAYSDVALRAAATEMAASGLIRAAKRQPLRVHASPGWLGLLGIDERPVWNGAGEGLRSQVDVIETVERGRKDEWSDYVWRSRGLDLAERCGVEASTEAPWGAFVQCEDDKVPR